MELPTSWPTMEEYRGFALVYQLSAFWIFSIFARFDGSKQALYLSKSTKSMDRTFLSVPSQLTVCHLWTVFGGRSLLCYHLFAVDL
jgi:hypothetical protein